MPLLKLLRDAFFAGLIAAAAMATAAWADAVDHVSEPDAHTRADYANGCNHYVNRARFKDRGADAEFVVILADSCEAALASLSSENQVERIRASIFLARLRQFRDTIISMNMQRVFGAEYGPTTRIKTRQLRQIQALSQISAAGEYLIAHSMGLLEARDAWLDTGPDFASAPERKG
ncbi:MAG: hypothetical protein AAGK00_12600 [Pseudomonadota bacterium]